MTGIDEKPSITIVDYDPLWPLLYQEEKQRILTVTCNVVVAIEHIGSTAVPGLEAKPIIDIMAAVHRLADAKRCIRPLESLGYEYVPRHEAVMPERRYFHKGATPYLRTHHLHMVEMGSDFWQSHLIFRDYLRARPDEARRYGRLKKALALKFGSERGAYTDAKAPFIEGIVDRVLKGSNRL